MKAHKKEEMKDKLTLKRAEQILFFLLCVGSLLPILLLETFPTLDGPAHLYNARIINELIFRHDNPLKEYYSFNTTPVPYWTCFILLIFFSKIFSMMIAEKLLLGIIVLGTAISFRKLLMVLHCRNMVSSWLIFPFIYSFPLYTGFYNFCFAIVFFFITLAYYIKRIEKQDIKTF